MTEPTEPRLDIARARRHHDLIRRSLANIAEQQAAIGGEIQALETGEDPVFLQRPDHPLFPILRQLRARLDSLGDESRRLRPELARPNELDRARAAYESAVAEEPPPWPDAGDVPLLLLPVRLETIHRQDELLIRVYPDDVHVDAHEEALTETERAAGERYWRDVWAAGPDPGRRATAWQALLDSLGPARAAWALDVLRPDRDPPAQPTPPGATPPDPGPFREVPGRSGTWTRAAHTMLLPDRFVFSGYKDGRLAWRRQGRDIPRPLAVGFAPPADGRDPAPDGLPWDERSRWLVDFGEAEANGMGLRGPAGDVDLLTVVGVTTGDDPLESAARWQAALRAHRYTDGLAVLPPGTPTNNTPAGRAGWDSRPDPRRPEEIDGRRAEYDPASEQPAARAAAAFGIDGRPLLASIPNALGGDGDALADLHLAVGVLGEESGFLGLGAGHFVAHVRGRGTLPTFLVGRQPYGVLPVTALELWRDDDIDDRKLGHLRSFMIAFERRLGTAPQAGIGDDQPAVFVSLLSRQAASTSARRVSHAILEKFPHSDKVDATAAVGSVGFDHPLFHLTTGGTGPDLTVVPDPPPELVALLERRPLAECAARLRSASEAVQGEPDLARFQQEAEAMRRALGPLGHSSTVGVFYPFAVPIHLSMWTLTADLLSRRTDPETPPEELAGLERRLTRLQQATDALARLEQRAAEGREIAGLPALDRLLCEVLDTVSHRVDAWAISVAGARLARLRAARPTGLRTGAYGWLTGLRDTGAASDGYILAPSLQHATTAAVLRAGFLAHFDQEALAVDLQSWRVRSALAVIDGVRSGQPLGALLGYQFERGLHDADLDCFIDSFRRQFPLPTAVDPAAPGSQATREAVGARVVVDGQALRRDRPALESDSPTHALLATADPTDRTIVRRLVAELDDAVDAAGDLLLAESVHHLVGGNPLRAGLSADAIGRGGLPSEFDVIRTPRSASAVSYHLGLLGPPDGGGPPGWSDDRRLARLEPAIEGWCRARLGGADAWRFACRVTDAAGSERDVEVRLGSQRRCALDTVLAALPGGASAPVIRELLALAAGPGETARLTDAGIARAGALILLCGQLRAVLAAGTPLLAMHLDPEDSDGWRRVDLDHLHARVGPWLTDVIATRDRLADLLGRAEPVGVAAALADLADLGLASAAPTGADPIGQGEQVLARLDALALGPLAAPPDPPASAATGAREQQQFTAAALQWFTDATTAVTAILGNSVKVVPILRLELPGAGRPPTGADPDAVADWLRGIGRVRPRVAALDDALVAGAVIGAGTEGRFAVAQTPVAPGAASLGAASPPWVATASTAAGPPARATIVLHHDGAATPTAVAGLVVDSWSEAIPHARPVDADGRPAALGPEEVAGVAFHYDRPGARAPQVILMAVPPNIERGWRLEDVHGVVEATLGLAQIRALQRSDLPEPLARLLLHVPELVAAEEV